MIEPTEEWDDFKEKVNDLFAEKVIEASQAASLDTEGDWRKPHFSDMSHNVKEEWTAQFFSACGVWYSMVGSSRDEGAHKCPRCVKALEDKGNG